MMFLCPDFRGIFLSSEKLVFTFIFFCGIMRKKDYGGLLWTVYFAKL